jgi:hypothetical protein
MALDPKQLGKVLKVFESGKANQVKLEQALGRGLLARLQGKKADLGAIFKELGGTDTVISHVLGNMTDKFNELRVDPGTTELKAVINGGAAAEIARAASCSASVSLMDMVSQPAFTFKQFATPATEKKTFGL